MIVLPFEHRTSGNCETGVMTNLLNNKGLSISEQLLFGVGSGLYFIYVPFINMGEHGPITAYRYTPGSILTTAAKRLELPLNIATYKNPQEANAALKTKIDQREYVGLTGDIYYFEVTPEFSTIHFYGHNVIVYGYEADNYMVSDPILQEPITISGDKLEKARFAKGKQNPKGKMYWFDDVQGQALNWPKAIKSGIKTTTQRMLHPIPYFGVKGMKLLAKNLRKYPTKKDDKFAKLHLNSIIRQIEFLGSGGSGYRKQFGQFLAEASPISNNNGFKEMSQFVMEDIVPSWRNISIDMVKCYREPVQQAQAAYETLSDNIYKVAQMEETLFTNLKKMNR